MSTIPNTYTLNTSDALGQHVAFHYPMNEGTGTSAADKSAGANAFALSGNVAWSTDVSEGAILHYTVTGGTVGVSGTGGYVSAASTSSNNIETFTIAQRFRSSVSSGGGYSVLATHESSSSAEPFATFIDLGAFGATGAQLGRLVFQFTDGTTTIRLFSPLSYTDGAWHQFIVSRTKSGAVKMYVDGVLVASSTDTTTGSSLTGDSLYIGDTGNRNFAGDFSYLYGYNVQFSDGGVTVGNAATSGSQVYDLHNNPTRMYTNTGTNYPKALSLSSASAPALTKGVGKSLAASSVSAASLSRGLVRTLAASSASALSLASVKGRAYLQSLAASSASSALLRKSAAKGLSLASGSVPALSLGRYKALAVLSASAPALGKGTTKTLSLLSASGLSIVKRAGKSLSAVSASAPSVLRGLSSTLTATSAAATAFGRGFAKTLIARTQSAALLISPRLIYDTVASDPFAALRLFRTAWAYLKGPPVITPQRLLPYLDLISSSVRTADFQATANILAGAELLLTGGDGISSTVYGTGDEDFNNDMGPVTDALVPASDPSLRLSAFYGNWTQKLNDHLSKAGKTILTGTPPAPAFSNLDQYASYQNSLTRYLFLVSPSMALLQWLYNRQQPNLLMQAANVFAPATPLGSGSVGAGAAVTFTPGQSIRTVNDTTNGLQGFTPAKGAAALVTTTVNGTLSLTVTASGWDSNGIAQTGRTWTATLSGLAAGQAVNLTPAISGDRISQITAMSGAGTATAGAFSLTSLTER